MTLTDKELYSLLSLYANKNGINHTSFPAYLDNSFGKKDDVQIEKEVQKQLVNLTKDSLLLYNDETKSYKFAKNIKQFVQNILLKNSSISLLDELKNSAEFYYSESFGYTAVVRVSAKILTRSFKILQFDNQCDFYKFIQHFLKLNNFTDELSDVFTCPMVEFDKYYYKSYKTNIKCLFSKEMRRINSLIDLGNRAKYDAKILLSSYENGGKTLCITKVLPVKQCNLIYQEKMCDNKKYVTVGQVSTSTLLTSLLK